MSRPVTILIPVFNRKRMVVDAILSAISQSYLNIRVRVYDDGSTDGTPEAIAATYPGVELIRGDHVGMTAAFNRLLATCEPDDLYCFLGSDDALTKDSVAKRVHTLYDEAADVVFSGLRFVADRRWLAKRGADHQIDVTAYTEEFSSFQGNVHTGTALFRGTAALPWHEGIKTGGADLLWVYQLWLMGFEFAYTPEVLYYVRRHEGRQIQKRRTMDQRVVQEELDTVYWPAVQALRDSYS
jgi:glycosyltransferase involved in cell wall biosynthesis